MLIRAITLDLDDTLWPIWPTIIRAEHALHEWLAVHAPRTAHRYPMEQMRELRKVVLSERPEVAHDFNTQRHLVLTRALRDSGDDVALADSALEVYITYRNTVEMYPGVAEALGRLAQRYPIAALTNGSADLVRIGIDRHFVFRLGATDHGAAKPDASIFLAACERLGLAPHQVLHVGDDPELDVLGAHRVGMRSAWINRDAAAWQSEHARPDFITRDLGELDQKLERDSTFY